MSDLIRRQAAINAIEHRLAEPAYQHTGEDWYVGMNCAESELYELPSAQPEPQWIPCSEMEPKKSGRYLCTHSGTGIVSPDYYTTQEQAEELFADPEDEYLDLEEYIGWTSKNVIAWMPLPEPYREDDKE